MIFPDDIPPDRRQGPTPSPWMFHRGGWLRNPLVLAVIGGVLVNLVWAIAVYAYNAAESKAEQYWRSYGAGLVQQAQHTNDPTVLRSLVERVQQSRASIQEEKVQ